MRASLLAIVALTAACGSPAPSESQADAPRPPEAAPTAARAIGTTSGLTGQTSALTGAISDFTVERGDFGTRIELAADTLFAFDQATLTPAAQTNLARTADLVRQGGAGKVTVIGYTDAKGEEAYNLDLSRRRAQAVVTWLKGQAGLADRGFEAQGRGEADPVAPNAAPGGGDDPEGRARNRRVVVEIPK